MELVKEVIVNLAQDLKKVREMEAERFHSTAVPIDHFLRKDQITSVRLAPVIILAPWDAHSSAFRAKGTIAVNIRLYLLFQIRTTSMVQTCHWCSCPDASFVDRMMRASRDHWLRSC